MHRRWRGAGTRVFTAQQLLDLPGSTLMLRMDSWRAAPDLFPNVLTGAGHGDVDRAGVGAGRCWRATRAGACGPSSDLADALAFRKAMEDSLVTGLRARDLQGRITYVNPAFCQMVGFGAEELLGARRRRALLADRAGRTNTASARRCGWPAACAAARGLRVGLHAQGRHALSGADHRGAADQRAGRCRPAG